MKNKSLNLRISERRLNKLREYSAIEDKTMTRILEDFIDSLPIRKVGIPHTIDNLVDQEQL
ncbi:hypothetical protein SD80_023220 [Scytonema tolypothrichoides VB-61278]|nr:hypothetical protein SD80_023220 [Scytonema tolypothrichoides VB-61278]